MNSLICGSLAFDYIMQFAGRFSKLLLADKLDKINISFLATTMRREFGGCAGNIAYNLKLLNCQPLIMATVGQDSEPYLEHFKNLNISTKHINVIPNLFTAQCFITTDIDNNQINTFHPGAMMFSHQNKITTNIANHINFVVIAPDSYDGMLQHAKQSAELNIPLIFDPGYGLPMFTSEELKYFINLATYIIVNAYEAELLTKYTHFNLKEIAQRVSALVVTRGKFGVKIFTSNCVIEIPPVIADTIVDPTGCGDAFRAGMLFGLTAGMDWTTIGNLSNLIGSIKISSQGSQNHVFTLAEIDNRFYKIFGYHFL